LYTTARQPSPRISARDGAIVPRINTPQSIRNRTVLDTVPKFLNFISVHKAQIQEVLLSKYNRRAFQNNFHPDRCVSGFQSIQQLLVHMNLDQTYELQLQGTKACQLIFEEFSRLYASNVSTTPEAPSSGGGILGLLGLGTAKQPSIVDDGAIVPRINTPPARMSTPEAPSSGGGGILGLLGGGGKTPSPPSIISDYTTLPISSRTSSSFDPSTTTRTSPRPFNSMNLPYQSPVIRRNSTVPSSSTGSDDDDTWIDPRFNTGNVSDTDTDSDVLSLARDAEAFRIKNDIEDRFGHVMPRPKRRVRKTKTKAKAKAKTKKCPSGKMRSPKTNRCINKKCPPGKILNPLTNRCVNRDGKIGQQVLADRKKKAKAAARRK
jgi:hypothetical protein